MENHVFVLEIEGILLYALASGADGGECFESKAQNRSTGGRGDFQRDGGGPSVT